MPSIAKTAPTIVADMKPLRASLADVIAPLKVLKPTVAVVVAGANPIIDLTVFTVLAIRSLNEVLKA
ncbi:hypothetical protein D3C74_439650 [compost metagenome]